MMQEAKDFWSRVDESSPGLGHPANSDFQTSTSSSTSRSSFGGNPPGGSGFRNPATTMPTWFMRPEGAGGAFPSGGGGADAQVGRKKFELRN